MPIFTGNDFNGASATANGQTWVTQAGAILSDSTTAFNIGTFDSVNYYVHGAVYSDITGIGSDVGSDDAYIYIGANGTITSASRAINLTGNNHTVVNDGTVVSDGDVGIWLIGSGGSITNSGTIHGSHGIINSGGNAFVANSGSIFATLVGVSLSTDNSTFNNTGLIQGNLRGINATGSIGSTIEINNYGTIASTSTGLASYGIFAGSTANVTVYNSGTILNRVLLGVYDDTFTNDGGTVDGIIDMDYGDDTFAIHDLAVGEVLDILGGAGSDTLDLAEFTWAVWADLEYTGPEVWTRDGNAVTSGTWRAIADIATFENLTGTMGVDVLRGNASANTFTFVGAQGIGGLDRYDGRNGNDTVSFDGFESAIWIDLSYTGSHAWTRDGSTVASGTWRGIASTFNIENVTGTDFNDELRGDGNANVLTGGRGNDLLVGAGGFDTFVFDDGQGADVIQDFDANDGERIDLSGLVEIANFADLITNHLFSVGGVATIDDTSATSITLTGWTTADFGIGDVISAADFIF